MSDQTPKTYVGTCTKFFVKEGYGFVRSPELTKDVLIHYTEIQEEGFRQLKKGEKVEYELITVIKGGEEKYQGKNVKKLAEAS